MTTLVVGASGATGRLLLEQLLAQGEEVKIIVRCIDSLPDALKQHRLLTITEASLLELSNAELLAQVQGCRAVVSCLGHNLTFKGLFAQPRRLVCNAVQRLCAAIEETCAETPVKFILMNTTGNQNSMAGESVSWAQSAVIGLIRLLLPPHADNEMAAAYLQSHFTAHQKRIEWAAVRPDSLIDETSATEYHVHQSPTRSASFDAGKTSRINVAHLMAEMIINEGLWEQWKYQMPVIYNAAYSSITTLEARKTCSND